MAESTSLDGLASYQEDDAMEVDGKVRSFFDGNCHKCGDKGHKAQDGQKGRGKMGQKEKGCFQCGRTTHLKRDCVAKPRVGKSSYQLEERTTKSKKGG